jgi:membrane-bound lytic murein transglycosylase F
LACSTDEEKKPQPDDGLGVTVTDPITRDFEQIKESGTLRMITRYSSNTYFLNQGLEWGFEYELVKEFAKTHDLTLDVIVVEPEQNPYDMLNNGTGDVIAANYTITPARKQYVAFTQPYNLVEQILIFSDVLKNPPSSVDEMAERNIPITVRSNSSYYQRLQNLQQAGIGVDIQLEPNKKDTESLLFEVAQGQHLATVADDNIFQAADIYMNGLMKGPTIAQNDTIAWAVRKNADELKKQMNAFLNQHFRFAEAGERPKRSGFLNVLRRRYFEGGSQVAGYYEPESRTSKSGVISPFDELFKKVADSAGVDWLMLAAITAKETQFKAGAKSWTGAMGLMQIMPATWGDLRDQLDLGTDPFDPRDNVLAGTAYLRMMHDRFGSLGFLAAYNAGPERYADHLATGRPLPRETRLYVASLLPLINASDAERMPTKTPQRNTDWRDASLFAGKPDRDQIDPSGIDAAMRDDLTIGGSVARRSRAPAAPDTLFVRPRPKESK